VLADFGELPILSTLQKADAAQLPGLRRCVSSWISKLGPQAQGLTVKDVLTMFYAALTRRYEEALVPVADLVNTATDSRFNVAHKIGDDGFELKVQRRVSAGSEILVQYCEACDNDVMLFSWGAYLEDNDNALNDIMPVNCSASWGPGEKARATVGSLREAAEQMLEPGGRARGRAPRCSPRAVASRRQGPLRCSLARLAWERCAQEWGQGAAAQAGTRAPSAVRSYAQALVTMGKNLLQEGKLPAARSQLEAAIQLDPGYYDGHSQLFSALDSGGDLAGAERSLRTAIAIEPGRFTAHNNLGDLLRRRGDIAGAARSFKAALGLSPGHPAVRENLRAVQRALGEL